MIMEKLGEKNKKNNRINIALWCNKHYRFISIMIFCILLLQCTYRYLNNKKYYDDNLDIEHWTLEEITDNDVIDDGNRMFELNCYFENRKHLLFDTDIKMDGNCAYIEAETSLDMYRLIHDNKSIGHSAETFEVPKNVNTIYFQNVIIWQDNLVIGNFAREIFELKCESDINKQEFKICDRLNMYDTLEIKDYVIDNEKKEITFISTKNIINEELYKDFFKSYACVILAAVENVESVECNYECNGIQKSYKLSSDEASKFVGKNIKNIFQKYSDVQWLLEKICCFSAKRKSEIDTKEQKDVYTNDLFDNKITLEQMQIEDNEKGSDYEYKDVDEYDRNMKCALNLYNNYSEEDVSCKVDIQNKRIVIEFNKFSDNEDVFIDKMKSYSYVVLAWISDLEEVEIKYRINNKEKTLIITNEDASKSMGENIKSYHESEEKFKQLVDGVFYLNYFCLRDNYYFNQ